MSAYSTLKQQSDERAKLVENTVAMAGAISLGRRRILSGIRWRDNLVVTAAEAVGGAERAGVRFEGAEFDAEVIATDLATDIAVLRIAGVQASEDGQASVDAQASGDGQAAGAATTGTAGHSRTPLRIGAAIVLVGRTARGPAAVWGSVQLAGPAWASRRGGRIDQRLEFDVGFEPGFEGAAVIDMDGAVAAMAVPGPYHRVLGIPAETIEAVVAKVEKAGYLPKPYVGVRLQPLWLDDDTRTKLGRTARGIAAVGGIDAGSPAADAHIELGDLLLTLDGEPAENVNALAQRIAGISPGQTIALEVLRGGKPLVVNVRVGERPRQ